MAQLLLTLLAAALVTISAAPEPRRLIDYPDVTFEIAGGCNGTESDCISLGTCEWLAHVADFANASSIDEARQTIAASLRSIDEDTWGWMQLPESVIDQIVANVTDVDCDLEEQRRPENWREFPYHPWEFECMDGPIAAPLNHLLLAENDFVRVINVYGIPFEAENFHVHRRMSMFIQWGAGGMPIIQYDENMNVVHDGVYDPEAEYELGIMWWPPQWLHSNYYQEGSQLATAPNCPLDQAPSNCTGFFYRVEFKIPGWE